MRKWSKEELDLLNKYYSSKTNEELIEIFNDNGFYRSKSSILTKANKLNIKKEYDEKFKICKKCNRKLPMTTEYFRKNKTYRNGFINICKECQGYHFTKDFLGRKQYTKCKNYSLEKISEKFPDKMKYFKYKNMCNEKSTSEKITTFICPNCGQEKDMKISSFIYGGFSCPLCSDGISFGEKLISYLLKVNNIKYVSQYSPSWIGNKRYDFYIPIKNMIIEVNGRQHYKETNWGDFNKLIENDTYKEKMALNNNIKHYIKLNCSESDIDFIFNSIKNENKLNFLKIENIDKKECYNEITKSNKIKVRDLFNNGKKVKEISKITNLEESTIRKWLRELKKYNMCNYDGKFNSKNSNSKSIKNVKTNTNFNSISEASRKTILSRDIIRKFLNDENNKEWIFI